MPRLVVNRAGKKQHASLAYSAFAEILNVPLRFEMREADRARVRRRPVEQVLMTREEGLKLGKIAEHYLETAINEFLAMAKGQRREELARSAGADRCVVLERDDLLEEGGVA